MKSKKKPRNLIDFFLRYTRRKKHKTQKEANKKQIKEEEENHREGKGQK